ncbi:JAB1/Mov34/MPN/PAD-1 ubiquitin protease-domain-containing protein [Amanita rubescens]|nr:JAB1/Mov34/MPN/PAD-1 ubiquitin protease-domain-containing protein [Amanita rubescens]
MSNTQHPVSTQNISWRAPSHVLVHPVALFSILDHYLRRTDEQDRVIGTLLGRRTDAETVEVCTAFAMLHSETSEQVAVDADYLKLMYDLCHKVNPQEVIVGWYSTGSSLNTYSSLIQSFYSQETAPYPAVHLALNTGTEQEEEPGIKAYISSPISVESKPENCVFLPVPVELRFHEAERSGLDLLIRAANSPSSTVSQPVTDLEILEASLNSVSDMLNRVLTYVRAVIAGEKKGDAAVGRYLMDALGSSTEDLEKGGFNSSLQDMLMISYLASLVQSQAEVSARLALTSV